jgi:hypothetical protein
MKIRISKNTVIGAALAAATLALGTYLGLMQVRPPALNEKSQLYPSYQRMMANIQRMAAVPHPSGSTEIDAVRAQIIDEIKGMGLNPVLESYTRTRRDGSSLELQNILVELGPEEAERSVMFVSHYDSTPQAPGAADDMLAVCAMLEAMRAHSQSERLKNGISFLFTDGEELGLLGARAFVEAYPERAGKIDMAINLEARGNRGAMLLFETSPKAFSLMQVAKKSGARPIGFSWAVAIYEKMPNSTDLTVFLRAGHKGINLAAIEGVEHYHRPSDSFENLDKATAMQYLSTISSLAGYAANNPLEDLAEPSKDAVYFPFFPGFLLLMTSAASHLLCIAACALALCISVLHAVRRRLKFSFSNIVMWLLVLATIASMIYFSAGSYLFSLPLLAMATAKCLKKWVIAHKAALVATGLTALLLWVPVVFLIWVSLVQPRML